MTRRTRRLRYVAALLCVVAQSALTVPARVPEPPVAVEEAPADPSLHIAPGGANVADGGSPLRQDAAMRDSLVDLLARDPGIGRGRGEDTRVAEPSTLVLVSVGLFALILWTRHRRR